jgi:diguanylate cyclase (GGDEF)-like protein
MKPGFVKAGLRRRPLSLRTHLGLGLALLVFAVSGALGGLIGQFSVDELRERIGQSLATDAQRMAERVTEEMAARTRELALISTFDLLRNLPANYTPPRAEQVQSLLDGLKRSFSPYIWIGVSDPQGRLLAATGGQTAGFDAATRSPLHDNVRDTIGLPGAPGGERRGTQISGVQVHTSGSNREQPVMDLVHVLQMPDGSVSGLVMAQLSWNMMHAIERSVLTNGSTRSSDREAFLISAHDEVLLGPEGTVGNRMSLPAIDRARAGFAGWTVETWANGEAYLTGAAFVAGDGAGSGLGPADMRWTVLVREPLESAYAPAYVLRDTIFQIGAVLALGFAGIGWLLATWITRPMARIANAAERLRLGDDVELPRLRGSAEIESLSASLRALVATLTRKQMALDEAEELAHRDPLTGLLNRSGLQHYLDRAMFQARISGINLIVFAADLDGFKGVNDTLGHAAGDELLCEIARRLTGCARTQDAVARVGGDEFILVLEAPTGPTDQTAVNIARRMLAVVQAPVPLSAGPAKVGCSFGGAAWPDDGEDMNDVMKKADSALYDIKRAGKGQIKLQGERITI